MSFHMSQFVLIKMFALGIFFLVGLFSRLLISKIPHTGSYLAINFEINRASIMRYLRNHLSVWTAAVHTDITMQEAVELVVSHNDYSH